MEYCTSRPDFKQDALCVKCAQRKPLEAYMPIDGKLLEILCCPVSKTPLKLLVPDRLNKLNAAIAAGEIQYVDGKRVEHELSEALITEDNKVIYPIEDSIPILLEDKGIGTTQLADF